MGSVTILKYRLELTTRQQKPALQGIEQSVYKAFRQVEEVSDFRILDMKITDGNRIHLAIKMSPRYSVSSMVNRIKGLTQHYVWQEEEAHLKQFYKGAKKKLWKDSFFCSTLGDEPENTVLSYIENQNGPDEEKDLAWTFTGEAKDLAALCHTSR